MHHEFNWGVILLHSHLFPRIQLQYSIYRNCIRITKNVRLILKKKQFGIPKLFHTAEVTFADSDSSRDVFREFFEIFKNKFITGQLRRTATDTPDLESQL